MFRNDIHDLLSNPQTVKTSEKHKTKKPTKKRDKTWRFTRNLEIGFIMFYFSFCGSAKKIVIKHKVHSLPAFE